MTTGRGGTSGPTASYSSTSTRWAHNQDLSPGSRPGIGRDEGIDLSAFEAKDFDPRQFVLKHRRRIPLPQLQKILSEKTEKIKTELVELINAKYSDFVSLSAKMKHLEALTQPILEPLKQNRNVCESFALKLDDVFF